MEKQKLFCKICLKCELNVKRRICSQNHRKLRIIYYTLSVYSRNLSGIFFCNEFSKDRKIPGVHKNYTGGLFYDRSKKHYKLCKIYIKYGIIRRKNIQN